MASKGEMEQKRVQPKVNQHGFQLRRNVGIDLGTVNILVYVEGRGIVLKEPSVVAVDKLTDQIVAVGSEAQALIGRTPANLETIRPMRDGVINHYDMTLQMIKYFYAQILMKNSLMRWKEKAIFSTALFNVKA